MSFWNEETAVYLDQHDEALAMSNTPKYRILVVDDDPSIREIMARVLEGIGYNVSIAEHGFDALLQLRSGEFSTRVSH